MIPAPANLKYKPYQIEGIEFALTRESVIIGDEMGLGKTIQGIGVLNGDPTLVRVLIVCPASLKLNWQRELETWLVHDRTVGLAQGRSFFPDTQIVVINYNILAAHRRRIHERKWDCIIMDEAQTLANKKAGQTKALFGGHKATPRTPVKAAKKIALTGTPIRNRPVELWPLLNFLDKGRFGDFRTYTRRYCDAKMVGRPMKGRGFVYVEDVSGSSNEAELQDRLRSEIMIRRMKADVLQDLAPITHQIVQIDIGAKALIKEENRLFKLAVPEKDLSKLSFEKIIASLEQQRDIGQRLAEIRKELSLKKVQFVVDHVRTLQAGGAEKVVVFAYHRETIAELTAAFGAAAVELHGGTSQKDRQAAVDAFQMEPSVTIFVGQILAAGTGLTLTKSSTVVLAEISWTPADIAQAIARVHRIGQNDRVLAQYIIARDSVDVNMAARVIEKQQVIEKCLDDRQETAPLEQAQTLNLSQLTTTLIKGSITMDEKIEQLFILLERITVALETAAAKPAGRITTRKSAAAKKKEAEEQAAEEQAEEEQAETDTPDAAPAEKPAAKEAPKVTPEQLRDVANELLKTYGEQTTVKGAARDAVLAIVSSVYPKFKGQLTSIPDSEIAAVHAALVAAPQELATEATEEF